MIILEENFKWHLEAFASELFIFSQMCCWKCYPASLMTLPNSLHHCSVHMVLKPSQHAGWGQICHL